MSKEIVAEHSKPVTVDELLRVITALGESQKDQFLQAAQLMAYNIAHPPPTDAQRASHLAALADRAEQARAADAVREHRRKYCVPPVDPNRPHRRPVDSDQGIWGGKTLIAWTYTTPSIKTDLGSVDGPLTAFGVCMRCGTEFRPTDPDYDAALSWGMQQGYGSYPMNKTTGHWSS